jgi:cysteine desulfurase/selenocysteine lyase
MDWDSVRSEFPALLRFTYLNTATFGQLPRRATDAVTAHWAHRNETASADFLNWFDDADRLRSSLARLINGKAGDIAFIPSAAHALALVMSGLNLQPGDNIVTLQDDFPNQLYLPQLREVPWERFGESIDKKTKLVAISEVNYATGFRPPLAEISEFMQGRDAILFVDGTQSCGALHFDVEATPVGMYAVHGYKWMISPNGAGFYYISPELRARLKPNVVGWRSHYDWRNVDNLHHGTPVFSAAAEKYEGGGLPSALLYAMEASTEMLLSIGIDTIEQRVLELAILARQRLERVGATVPSIKDDTGSQIVCAKFPGHDPSHLARELKKQGVLVAARHGGLRVSPHLYNNEADVERLAGAVEAVLR